MRHRISRYPNDLRQSGPTTKNADRGMQDNRLIVNKRHELYDVFETWGNDGKAIEAMIARKVAEPSVAPSSQVKQAGFMAIHQVYAGVNAPEAVAETIIPVQPERATESAQLVRDIMAIHAMAGAGIKAA
jgi:hypothetical protein